VWVRRGDLTGIRSGVRPDTAGQLSRERSWDDSPAVFASIRAMPTPLSPAPVCRGRSQLPSRTDPIPHRSRLPPGSDVPLIQPSTCWWNSFRHIQVLAVPSRRGLPARRLQPSSRASPPRPRSHDVHSARLGRPIAGRSRVNNHCGKDLGRNRRLCCVLVGIGTYFPVSSIRRLRSLCKPPYDSCACSPRNIVLQLPKAKLRWLACPVRLGDRRAGTDDERFQDRQQVR